MSSPTRKHKGGAAAKRSTPAPARKYPETEEAIVKYLVIYPPGSPKKFQQGRRVLYGRKASAERQEETLKNIAAVYARLHGLPNVSAGAEKLIEDLLTAGKWEKWGGRDIRFKLTEDTKPGSVGRSKGAAGQRTIEMRKLWRIYLTDSEKSCQEKYELIARRFKGDYTTLRGAIKAARRAVKTHFPCVGCEDCGGIE